MTKVKQVYMMGIAMVFLVVLGLVHSGYSEPTPRELPPIKVGALLSMTAGDPVGSNYIHQGIKFKLNEVGLEVAGRKIMLIMEDDAADPAIAVDKARKLVEKDRVDVVLGPLFSHCGIAVANYLTKSKTPNISPLGHPIQALKFGGGNVFLHPGTLGGTTAQMGTYAYDEIGYRTATVLVADYVTGEEYAKAFSDTFEAKGGRIVQTQRAPIGTMDFSAYVTGLAKADCLFLWLVPPDAARFAKQYNAAARKLPVICSPAFTLVEDMLAEIGDPALGWIGQGYYSSEIDTPINRKFVNAYTKAIGNRPIMHSEGGYAMTTLFLEAVQATRGETSHEAINKALGKIKVELPGGNFHFTSEGLGVGDQYILKVVKKDGRYIWDVVKKYDQVVVKALKEKF